MLTIETLVDGHDVSAARRETLETAIALGASDELLVELRDALRVNRNPTIILPRHHLEGLSRGSGWCRKGRGDSAQWGERVDSGYKVGPGTWIVCGKDGFRREKRDTWTVKHVQVADQTWTVAN